MIMAKGKQFKVVELFVTIFLDLSLHYEQLYLESGYPQIPVNQPFLTFKGDL